MALRRSPDRDAPVAVEDVPLALCRGIREATVREHPELGDDVEDVATLSEARGHGLARSLVLGGVARLRAEGCDLIVIVAGAQDFPRELYGRLGFDVIGAIRRFRRAT